MLIQEVKQKKIIPLFLSRHKNRLLLLAKLIIASGLLWYIVSAVSFDEIVNAINNADVKLIAVAIILSILNLYLQFYKWKITANVILKEESNAKILTSLFYGFSAGVITPARIGEYFGRAIAFKDKSLIQVTLATLVDKFFPLVIVTLVGSVSALFYIHFFYNVSVYITLSLFIVLFSALYFISILLLSDKFWEGFLFNRIRHSDRLFKLYQKVKVFKDLDKNYSLRMLLISFLFYVCFLVQYAVLVAAFSTHGNFLNYIWAANLIMFAKTIIPPVSLGELGIREGASIYFIGRFGETASVGFNASIFLFLINILLPALIGMILLLKKNND